jgi:hypothetical protein
MGGPRHSSEVVFYGGGIKPTPEGIGFAHFANRLGALEKTERWICLSQAFSIFSNS